MSVWQVSQTRCRAPVLEPRVFISRQLARPHPTTQLLPCGVVKCIDMPLRQFWLLRRSIWVLELPVRQVRVRRGALYSRGLLFSFLLSPPSQLLP